jgi:hypothetical protein
MSGTPYEGSSGDGYIARTDTQASDTPLDDTP